MPPSPSLRRTRKSPSVCPIRSAEAAVTAGEGVVLLGLSIREPPLGDSAACRRGRRLTFPRLNPRRRAECRAYVNRASSGGLLFGRGRRRLRFRALRETAGGARAPGYASASSLATLRR